MLLTRKINYYLYKNHSFRQLVLSYLLLELLEVFIRSFSWSVPLGMLFPTMLYILHQKLLNKRVRPITHWYMVLPFFAFAALHIYLFLFSPTPDSKRLWLQLFSVGYALYAFIIVLLIFIGTQKYEEAIPGREKLLIIQLSLLMFMGVTVIGKLFYFGDPKLNQEIAYKIKPRSIMFIFLLLSVFLKINYLYRKKNPEYEKAREFAPPSAKKLGKIQIKLSILLKDRLYLRKDLNKELLARECMVTKEDISYFFDNYLEKDFRIFIAEYRIAYALSLMKEKGKEYTLEAIAHESGFKSKKTFNKYFLMVTNKLPSEFMKS